MNRLILIFFLLSPLSMQSHNGLCTIRKAGENVYVSSQIDDHHEINYWFKKCMANDLFTFYRVSVKHTVTISAHLRSGAAVGVAATICLRTKRPKQPRLSR